MPKLISGESLLGFWNIEKSQLLKYAMEGLQPYDRLGRPIVPPNIEYKLSLMQEYENLIEHYRNKQHYFFSESFEKHVHTQYNDVYRGFENDLNKAWPQGIKAAAQLEKYEKPDKRIERTRKTCKNTIECLSRCFDILFEELSPIPDITSWKNYDPSLLKDGTPEIETNLKYALFSIDDVSKIASKYKLENPKKTRDNFIELERKKPEYAFWIKGDYWQVIFKGKEYLFRDLESLRHVIYLLDNPNKVLKAYDIVEFVKGTNVLSEYDEMISKIYNEMDVDELFEKEGLEIVESPSEELSETDLESIRSTAYLSWADYIAAIENNEGNEKAEEDWNKYKRYVLNSYGVFIFVSRSGKVNFIKKTRTIPELNKIRIGVKKNITNAINNIKKHIPSLADYLQRNLETGVNCVYKPDPEINIEWDIRWYLS